MNILAQIKSLQQQANQLELQLADLEQRFRDTNRMLRNARLKALYLRSNEALRAPAEKYSLWHIGVRIVGSAIAAAIAFVLLFLLNLSVSGIVIGAMLAAFVMFALLSWAMVNPATASLPKLIAEQEKLKELSEEELSRLNKKVENLREQILTTNATIKELTDSNREKREQLLKQNWKTMQGADWVEYLVQVFEALGASAQTARMKGVDGVDLIVRFGEVMIAVQAKGYVGSVDKEAIAQVVAGKTHYDCDRAAVITNSRFSAPARPFAASRSCYLIGEKEFPAFVMGSNLEMFE